MVQLERVETRFYHEEALSQESVRYLEGDDLSSRCHSISFSVVGIVSRHDSFPTEQSRAKNVKKQSNK